MKVINLTPHAVNVLSADGTTMLEYPPSGDIARVAEIPGDMIFAGAFPFAARRGSQYGDVTGLPRRVKGTIYIVSGMVAAAVPNRLDVFCPGEAIRDDAGRTIGVKYLKCAV